VTQWPGRCWPGLEHRDFLWPVFFSFSMPMLCSSILCMGTPVPLLLRFAVLHAAAGWHQACPEATSHLGCSFELGSCTCKSHSTHSCLPVLTFCTFAAPLQGGHDTGSHHGLLPRRRVPCGAQVHQRRGPAAQAVRAAGCQQRPTAQSPHARQAGLAITVQGAAAGGAGDGRTRQAVAAVHRLEPCVLVCRQDVMHRMLF